MKKTTLVLLSAGMMLVTQACSSQAPLPNVQTASSAKSPDLAPRATDPLHSMTNCSGGADTCTVGGGGGGYGGDPGTGGGAPMPCRVTKIIGRFQRDCGSGPPIGGGGGVTKNSSCSYLPSGSTPIDSKGDTFNSIAAGNSAVQNLLIGLENSGYSINVAVNSTGTDPSDPTATASTNMNFQNDSATVTFYSSVLNASGNDPVQSLFQELDHIYYSFGPMAPTVNLPKTGTLNIGGTSYNYGLFPVNQQLPSSYFGYQHGLIHDDLFNAFGSDQTGALQEALQQANNPPQNPAAIANQNRNRLALGSPSFAPPNLRGQTCTSSAPQAHVNGSALLVTSAIVSDH